MNKDQRKWKAIVEQEGLMLDDMVRGRHWKLYVSGSNGQRGIVIVSVTSGDHREERNIRSLLRRIANGEDSCRTR